MSLPRLLAFFLAFKNSGISWWLESVAVAVGIWGASPLPHKMQPLSLADQSTGATEYTYFSGVGSLSSFSFLQFFPVGMDFYKCLSQAVLFPVT